MSSADVVKQLKIKTNSLKRLQKELSYYGTEQAKEQAKVESLKAQEADAHDIKQAENVLAESSMMIPETRQRTEMALAELQSFLADNEADVAGSQELEQAREVIQAAEGVLST